MAKFLSPYRTKWYGISVNRGYNKPVVSVFGKILMIRYLKQLFQFSWGLGKNKKHYFVYLTSFDDGKLNMRVIEYMKKFFIIDGCNTKYDNKHPNLIKCEFNHPNFGIIYVGDIFQALMFLNMGIRFFETPNVNELYGEELFPVRKVASIGYHPKHNSWWGWSHRGCAEFKIGHQIEDGDLVVSWNPFMGDTLPMVWDKTLEKYNVKPGYIAKTIEDCKLLAMLYAEAVA